MPNPSSHNLRVTTRDLDVLDALSSYRFLSVPQVAALYFPSAPAAESRLRSLYQADLATRVFMPVRPHDRSVSTIYALARKGSDLLAERHDGHRPPFLTGAQQRSALFLDHTLRRNDVRICLELLDRDLRGFHLLAWRQSPEEVRGSAVIKAGRSHRRVPIVPDGFFAVRWHGHVEAFCLEVDMGTVNIERMLLRYRAYWKWWKEGGADRRFGRVPIRVLTMTTTERRLTRLRGLAVRSPDTGDRGTGLHWFALLTLADIHDPQKLIGKGWTAARCGAPQPGSLLN